MSRLCCLKTNKQIRELIELGAGKNCFVIKMKIRHSERIKLMIV